MAITLSEMVSAYGQKVTDLTIGLTSISASIVDLQDQVSEAENTLSDITSATDVWGATKATTLSAMYTFCSSAAGGYGTTNLTAWQIVSGGTGCTPPYIPVYTWSNVTCAAEEDQWFRKLDFDEIYDHINDSVDVNGTYGLNANITNLQIAESVLEADKDKYEDLVESYGRYK